MGIRRKMAHGAFWLFLEKGAQQVASFVVFAVIARLIGPEEYGLVALCGIVMTLMNNITSGLVDSVISMRIRDDLRLSSLFWTVAGGGAVLSLLAYVLAGPFAALFGQPKLTPLLEAFSVLPFLFALAAVPTALITATMNFRLFTLRTLIASLISGAVGVYGALRGWGAHALAAQQIVAQTIVIAVVWKGLNWRPKLLFTTKALSEMLSLGFSQTASLFIMFFQQQTPRLILGLLLGPLAVGHYAFALRISYALQDMLFQPLLLVVYPAFANHREHICAQKELLKQTVTISTFLFVPAICGAIATAPIFIPLIFGSQWSEATTLVQIFLVVTLMTATSAFVRNLFRAHKLTSFFLRIQTIAITLEILTIASLAKFGTKAFSYGVLTISILTTLMYSHFLFQKTGLNLWANKQRQALPLATSLIMVGAIFLYYALFPPISASTTNLLIATSIGVATYSGLCLLFLKQSLLEAISKLRSTARTPAILGDNDENTP